MDRFDRISKLTDDGRSRVIWLGDLNYRIALSYTEAKKLVQANDWGALFEKDQVTSQPKLIRPVRALHAGMCVSHGAF